MAYWMLITGCAILAYVGWFSVLKFRRVKQEKAQFSKMQDGINSLKAEDGQRMIKGLR